MGEKFIRYHHTTKGQLPYTEDGGGYLSTPQQPHFVRARHFTWIPAGVSHSIHPSAPEVIMPNPYFPVSEKDDPFFSQTGIYPVDDLLMELMMFTNRWNGNIRPDEESRFSIARAFKMLLPELSKG